MNIRLLLIVFTASLCLFCCSDSGVTIPEKFLVGTGLEDKNIQYVERIGGWEAEYVLIVEEEDPPLIGALTEVYPHRISANESIELLKQQVKNVLPDVEFDGSETFLRGTPNEYLRCEVVGTRTYIIVFGYRE